jgi:23S rRNA pseudouridine1911/1915/1917 synthase
MPDPSEITRRLAFKVPSELAGQRLDLVLETLVEELSRARLQKLVRRGKVQVNGKRVLRSNLRVSGGTHLLLDLGSAEGDSLAEALEVLHLDEEIVAIAKPAGLVMHPTERIHGGTVCELVATRFGRLSTIPGDHRPGVVHRLDRGTSGVVVLARSDRAAHALKRQFREREAKKTYLAIVYGNPAWEERTLHDRIGSRPGHVDLQMIDPPEHPRDAVTTVEVRERFDRYALVECHPRTGRRHQLRLQLHHAGHPIVGDELYRPSPPPPRDDRILAIGHQALHARELRLTHPATGEELRLRAELPADILSLLEALGDGA